jgi:predicted DsbA family dithiol-disulfide isomerase
MKIDLFHDTACPWCRIGKAHLAAALAQWDEAPVTVHYRAFFLQPNAPPEGINFRDFMLAKSGGQIPPEQWFSAPREMGQRAGLTFNFEQIEYFPNTLLSHQLIALAADAERDAVTDAIYAAYFEHGRDIGSLDVLAEIAGECGLDSDHIRSQLQQNARRDAVLTDVTVARQIGVTGVPFFVVDHKLAFSGAQPTEVILDVLRQAKERA